MSHIFFQKFYEILCRNVYLSLSRPGFHGLPGTVAECLTAIHSASSVDYQHST